MILVPNHFDVDGRESRRVHGRASRRHQEDRAWGRAVAYQAEGRAARWCHMVEISQLLNLQTEQLRQQGLQDLKTATFKELGALKKDVRKHGDFIEQLRDQHAMDQRIKALEEKGPAASTTASGPGRPNLLILAGWPHDTAKDTLLAELQQMPPAVGFVAHLRRVLLHRTSSRFRDGVPDHGCIREWTATQAQDDSRGAADAGLRAASMEHMEPGKTLRATLGKPPHERLVSNHAGKTKQHRSDAQEQARDGIWRRQRLAQPTPHGQRYPRCAPPCMPGRKTTTQLDRSSDALHHPQHIGEGAGWAMGRPHGVLRSVSSQAEHELVSDRPCTDSAAWGPDTAQAFDIYRLARSPGKGRFKTYAVGPPPAF